MSGPFPAGATSLTTLLVVSDLARSVAFYRDVLGARLYGEYGGTSAVFEIADAWILIVTGGEPTPDKPTVSFVPPADRDHVDHEVIFRVDDCRAAHEELSRRGAEFLTPPLDRGGEIRCFLRDPDGHLIELSELTGGAR
jgi:catechol 2,3-dioxygenase-like lactoylglutathione lyase family enzyme